ncbi:MAG TPA: branched-chain amino acid ABC transporter permease, partial [Lacipirellulaceae bacterium]|nr:branched-chain amino acid ABC transporter permease [Lacipirellulaceae bacterium]
MIQPAKQLGPYAIGFVLSIAMYLVLPRAMGPYYARILLDAGIAMNLAVSLNIVSGLTGQFSMGHAGFMACGGYVAAFITYYASMLLWGSTATHGGLFGVGAWLFVGACIIGGLVAAALGYFVGLPSLRLRGDYLAIVTLGFGEIVRVILQQTAPVIDDPAKVHAAHLSNFLPPPVGGSEGFFGVPKYTNMFWVYAFLTITVVASYRLKQSGFGRAMISVREDEFAAQAMGVNVARIKVLAFVLAAFFAGMAGGLYSHEFGLNISPEDAGFQRSFDYLIMTVLGGSGSISGVMLAAALLTSLPEMLRGFSEYRLIAYALLLIGMMLMRPQ